MKILIFGVWMKLEFGILNILYILIQEKRIQYHLEKKIQIIKEILLLQQYQQKVRKFQFLESNIVQKKVIWKRQRKENPKKLFNKEKLQESIQNICGRVKFFLGYSKSGDILIMDNLSVHKNKKCLDKLQKAGIQVMFLPTYSAVELSPLDNSLFHQLKQNLKNKESKFFEEKIKQVQDAFTKISEESVCNYWSHCGLIDQEMEIGKFFNFFLFL